MHERLSRFSGSTKLDQILFVADKITWDQPGEPPYIELMMRGLEKSLCHGMLIQS